MATMTYSVNAGEAVILFAFVLVYFLPSLVATFRAVKHFPSILVINTTLGWTVIIWGLCMAWALKSKSYYVTPKDLP